MLVQRQHTIHTTRPLTTAHLAQTMTLLSLTAVELRQRVEAELAINPALELVEERRCPTCKRLLVGRSPCPVCSRPQSASPDQPVVFVSPREDFYTYSGSRQTSDGPDDGEMVQAAVEPLPIYVLRQVASDLPAADRLLAAYILNNLDEDGLLTTPPVEIARYHHLPLSKVEQVIQLIQHADPVGVGSSTPQQALLVQLDVLGETRLVPPYTKEAIEHGWDLLSRHRYPELGMLLGATTTQAREAASYIRLNLNPFPGRAHWGENLSAQQNRKRESLVYYFPDVIINRGNDKEDTPFWVEIALPLSGTLRVNPLFRQALKQAPDEKVDEWKESLEQAHLLVKCVQQRNHTMVRLMQNLVVLQREFILHGSGHMKPITRASLSKTLDVHESTISRAVSGKSVQLPTGRIVPLDLFFDRSLHIRTALKEIIENEQQPLSDIELCDCLYRMGFKVARRTVAKYRSMEGILPAHLRKPIQAAPLPGARQADGRQGNRL